MDYNGDAISDQEWGVADDEYLDMLLDSPDEEEHEPRFGEED